MSRGQNNDLSNASSQLSRIKTESEKYDINANQFQVKARRLVIEPHENADALEMARIDDYFAVVKKGEFQTGDLALYIPEGAIVPDNIISAMGLEGRLAGGTIGDNGKRKKNRVKAVRLRGRLSQGLVFQPDNMKLEEGKDYAEELDISKWRPPIPAHMSGQVVAAPKILSYTDIANIKKFPDVLQEGEEVIACEKIHGTCTITALIDGELAVSSKGNATSGRALKPDPSDDGREQNVYWRMSEKYQLQEALQTIAERVGKPGQPVHIYGETLGVQDLMYGLDKGELDYRVFDIRVGQDFLDYDECNVLCQELNLPTVPLLYRGPYSREKLEEVATGKESITGEEANIREGVVVRPNSERIDPTVGRVIFKVISPDYLLRGGEASELE